MAQELIDGITTSWNPAQCKDTYYDDVMSFFYRKIDSGELSHVYWGELEKEEAGNTGQCGPHAASLEVT
jgi:non-homologous end joining protein Ku